MNEVVLDPNVNEGWLKLRVSVDQELIGKLIDLRDEIEAVLFDAYSSDFLRRASNDALTTIVKGVIEANHENHESMKIHGCGVFMKTEESISEKPKSMLPLYDSKTWWEIVSGRRTEEEVAAAIAKENRS
jgi:hypothetical protein